MSSLSRTIEYVSLAHSSVPKSVASQFHREVQRVLGDDRGWSGLGYLFSQVSRQQATRNLRSTPEQLIVFVLTPPSILYADKYREFEAKQLSVADLGTRCIPFNLDRWQGTCTNLSQLPLKEYREYLINHETGHMLHFGHFTGAGAYPNDGANPAPVMMQQTLGIGDFQPNSWPVDGVDNSPDLRL